MTRVLIKMALAVNDLLTDVSTRYDVRWLFDLTGTIESALSDMWWRNQ
jgi:hypothetical protein